MSSRTMKDHVEVDWKHHWDRTERPWVHWMEGTEGEAGVEDSDSDGNNSSHSLRTYYVPDITLSVLQGFGDFSFIKTR